MATVYEIKAVATGFTQWPGFTKSVGHWPRFKSGEVLKFNRPVPLTVEKDLRIGASVLCKRGQVVNAQGVDISNKYAGTVHVEGVPYWWPASMFSLGADPT